MSGQQDLFTDSHNLIHHKKREPSYGEHNQTYKHMAKFALQHYLYNFLTPNWLKTEVTYIDELRGEIKSLGRNQCSKFSLEPTWAQCCLPQVTINQQKWVKKVDCIWQKRVKCLLLPLKLSCCLFLSLCSLVIRAVREALGPTKTISYTKSRPYMYKNINLSEHLKGQSGALTSVSKSVSHHFSITSTCIL